MSGLFFIIVFGYALMILLLSKEILTYPATKIDPTKEQLPFSIIINYRDEQNRLPALLNSIKKQQYRLEKTQWIFVNDKATDHSLEILQSFKVQNPKLQILLLDRIPKSASGKKDGITQALASSKYRHILTTDADCILPTEWVLSYNAIYNEHPDAHFIAAPVVIKQENTILTALQQQEMMALQLITAGSFSYRQPFMCNGANMSFTKEAFYEVNGYHGNNHISSGDDVFLLEKLAAEDVMKCRYLKSTAAMVITFPKLHLKSMIYQRARWAQKGSKTKSMLNKLLSFQVLLMSLLFITSPLLWSFSVITSQMFIGVLLVKAFTDIIVLVIADQFFGGVKWRFVIINFLIYPFLVLMIAVKSLSKPIWQGRTVNTPASPQD
ncbi:glycosyltransferase [Nonlabens sp. Ci31]|uniref:glycosyltransferase family 2 protein n=1 Tax=Nonlabens sp. Ci31 TaxID=2608253 RepID=UPI001463E42A|nr:glycosyltransferase [Nonlabens sp. Ci31]QJP34204.1 glycosyltransferase [Nonlabens sp. Ci31]